MSPAASLPVIPVISEKKWLCFLADVSNGMRKKNYRHKKVQRKRDERWKETNIRIQAHSSFDMSALNAEAVPALSSLLHIGNGVRVVRCSPGKSVFVEAAFLRL